MNNIMLNDENIQAFLLNEKQGEDVCCEKYCVMYSSKI